jgi:hypothetical protein
MLWIAGQVFPPELRTREAFDSRILPASPSAQTLMLTAERAKAQAA